MRVLYKSFLKIVWNTINRNRISKIIFTNFPNNFFIFIYLIIDLLLIINLLNDFINIYFMIRMYNEHEYIRQAKSQ